MYIINENKSQKIHVPFMKIFQNGKIRNSTSFGCIFGGNQYTVRYEQNWRG